MVANPTAPISAPYTHLLPKMGVQVAAGPRIVCVIVALADYMRTRKYIVGCQ